jgi:hypothetical protein
MTFRTSPRHVRTIRHADGRKPPESETGPPSSSVEDWGREDTTWIGHYWTFNTGSSPGFRRSTISATARRAALARLLLT